LADQKLNPAQAAAQRENAIVALRNEISPWLMILRVVPDGWQLPDFEPGQFAVVGLPGSAQRCSLAEAEETPPDPDKLIRRAYSIASSSLTHEFMEFYVALVTSGTLTPRLFALNIGDHLWLGPKIAGMFSFTQVPDDKSIVLIATGTGLAPYMSMLTTYLTCAGPRRLIVLHGARHSWDLGYRSELLMLQHLCSNFAYVPVISRPEHEPAPWVGAIGYVQDLWTGGAIDRIWGFHPTPENTHVFLCGSPAMIDSVEEILFKEQFKEHTKKVPGEIHVERYW
jgi:ferredoxin/flavodoxin---NADP+ reductase